MHLKCDDHRIFFSLTLTPPPPFLPSSSTTLVETTFKNCHLRLECIWNKWPFMRRFHDPLRFHLIKKASKRNVLTSCFGLNLSFIQDRILAFLRLTNFGLKIPIEQFCEISVFSNHAELATLRLSYSTCLMYFTAESFVPISVNW